MPISISPKEGTPMRYIKKYKMEEKLMEVPRDFLKDCEGWLYKLFGSHMAYLLLLKLDTIQFYKTNNRQFNFSNHMDDIEREGEYKAVLTYLLSQKKYADPMILRLIRGGREIISYYTLSDYPSKYGDLSKIRKTISVRYKKRGSGSDGAYMPKTKNIVLYPSIFKSVLAKQLRVQLVQDEYLITSEFFDNERTDWLLLDKRGVDEVLDLAVRTTLFTIEHEFIHLIQDFLFKATIKDVQYSTGIDAKYYSSPFEVNPWLISSLSELEMGLKSQGKFYDSDDLERFISGSTYFQVLKDVDFALYKKMVGSFYQLVDERLDKELIP